ncbi:hypothetical protein E4U09_004218 [Claviceps aff. purpurea]|uniref:ubiquitinyl hydrolase 1 n=1 Tax=Claviceps aff. purpurea TaxID=1967640 RepID=A0A9P7TZW4_9HYPO|nr:hypothetical protein E4U09_004218 [Claviceps aff. purpurea]
MEHQTPHDVAAQQEAAKDYQPALQGPLVGEKTPSHIITQEYAKADQVYIEKTTALPETYSHYRPIQGDGNCGWRAIGFSYFEKLVEGGDQSQIEGEVARLKSLNHLLSTVGGYDYFEDFAEEAFDLLREVAAIIDKPQAAYDLIRQRWNDVGVEGSLIFYFRLLAATFLKANAATYEPFIPGGQSVAGYCGQNIEVVNREIEQLGIIALVNILLKPLNFVLEIAYLDRSPGSQVNRYRFPDEANGKDVMELGPIIHLLYRPDHYDILYQSHTGHPPAPTSPSHLDLQVNRVAGFTQNAAFTDSAAALNTFSAVDFGALSMIPGISNNAGNSLAGMISMSATPSSTTSATVDSYSSSQQDSWMSPFPSEMQSAKAGSPRQPQLLANVHPSSQSAPLPSTGPMGARRPLIAAGTSLGSQQLSPLVTTAGTAGYPIRFSPHQWEYENKSFSEPIFQVTTNTFKNSIWNRAHYGNPDFQPEEWNPDEDGPDTRQVGKRKVRKDSR